MRGLEAVKRWGGVRLLAAGVALVCLAGPAWAASSYESADPEAIEKRIEELKVFYKEDHPDIQRQRRYLEKAIELKAQRESEAMEADKEKRKPAPPENKLQEGDSFR